MGHTLKYTEQYGGPATAGTSDGSADTSELVARLEQVIADLDSLGLSLAAALAQNALDVIPQGESADADLIAAIFWHMRDVRSAMVRTRKKAKEGRCMVSVASRPDCLEELFTTKQIEVMNLLVQHMTSKEISRELGISPKTVEHHVAAVRGKLGTADRNATARAYLALLGDGGKFPTPFSPVDGSIASSHELMRDLPKEGQFSVSDAASFGDWKVRHSERRVLEALDARFGIVGRIGLVIVLAMLLAVTLLLSLSIASGLDKVI